MKKIFLIIQREYLTRVRKKSFLVTTLLLPLAYLGLMFGTSYLAKETASTLKVAVVDESGYFSDTALKSISDKSATFHIEKMSKDSIAATYQTKGYNAYLHIPSFDWRNGTALAINSTDSKGDMTKAVLESKINILWNGIKQEKLGLDLAKKYAYENSKLTVDIKNAKDPKADSKAASSLASVLAFLIYFIILLYGSQVMMSVMEEKTNRIAEVIVSSVKPFQLMMGKIIGVGLVALTQFLLWIGLILVAYNVAKASGAGGGSTGQMVEGMQKTFAGINIGYIIVFFVLYFIGGFFFYASIYAAIGSAVNEDIRDAQQLSFPVTMLIIFSFFITIQAANDPSSNLAFWGSMIPFSSPLVMMGRIPYGIPATVPWWQVLLSLVILYSSIIGIAWVSAKIYRTGILMYGKKVTLKEMVKWIWRK
jgi:ABC-2 type transport system permease protein